MLTPTDIERLQLVMAGRAGLSGEFFTESRIFDSELAAIFLNSWVCAGASDDVAKPGSVFPLEMARQPILLARDRDGKLRAFFNTCSHRGSLLVEKPAKSCPRIVCPYHAWSYDLAGKLKNTPHVGGAGIHHCAGIANEKLGLKPLAAAEWAGLVFINMSQTPEPFEDFIRPIAERLKSYDFSQLRLGIETTAEARANWKIVVENFVESYHLPWVHADMNRFNPMEDHYQILGGATYLGQGLKNMRPTDEAAYKLPPFPNLTPEEMTTGESHFLFGNLMFGVLVDYLYAIILFPMAAAATHERLVILFNGEAAATAPDFENLRRTILERMVSVNNEDMTITERVQAGRHSLAFTGGQFAGRQEKTSEQFQAGVAARLLAAAGHNVATGHLGHGEIHHDAPAGKPQSPKNQVSLDS